MDDDRFYRFRQEMRLSLNHADPRLLIMVPYDRLPEPLQGAAKRMSEPGLTPKARADAARDFLALYEEFEW